MSRVVLGGGFLGSHLAEHLARGGAQVRLLSLHFPFAEAYRDTPGLSLVEGDFLNQGMLREVLRGAEVVYHLVWSSLPQTSNHDPQQDVQSNIGGTLRLLQLCLEEKVRCVVFASSGGTIYGLPQTTPIAEDHPTSPLNSYGITKLTVEKYLQLFQHLYGLDYRVLRVANPYGERQRPTGVQGVIAAFLHKALHDEEITIWGDGSVVRDFIYVGDLVEAMARSADYTGPEKVFNIGAGAGLDLNGILAAIETLLARKLRVKYLPGRPFDVPVNILDTERAQRCFGWRPQVSLDEGLSRTARWQRASLV